MSAAKENRFLIRHQPIWFVTKGEIAKHALATFDITPLVEEMLQEKVV
jgi:hypothetical protein